MTRNCKYMMAISAGIAISLSACGGSGNGVSSAPVPPALVPPSTATPAAATIGAPAIAALPNTSQFPEAVNGGATLTTQSRTLFPLLQSVVSISPAGVAADAATINAGTVLAFDSSHTSYDIDIKNPAVGVTDLVLNSSASGLFQADLGGGQRVTLEISNPSTSNLAWTSYGFWDVAMPSGARAQASFVTGYATPAGSVPMVGTATYSGHVRGEVILAQAGRENGVNYLALSGDALLQASFSSGTITADMSAMFATDFDGSKLPWNSVHLSGTLFGPNLFSGTSAATSEPGNMASLKGTAVGTFAGSFFGPNAQELGAVWTLWDGISAAFGTIGAKDQNSDGCTACWDY